MKTAIVNLVTQKYIIGQQRLKQSLIDVNYDGDFFGFVGEESVGSPKHTENPYAFKIYAINKVRELGYTKILWLDASVYAVKNVQPVFDWISEKGIFMEAAGHLCGSWANENQLNYFKITREEAMLMPMFSAGFVAFDFENEVATMFYNIWQKSMLDGAFIGSWENSRHDMTCGSIIANKMGLNKLYSQCGYLFSYIGSAFNTPNETAVFHLQGLV